MWRTLGKTSERPLLVAALIPSYSDEQRIDPTVRYCCKVAQVVEGGSFDELIVVNMYAKYIAATGAAENGPKHTSLSHTRASNVDVGDLVGPDNDDRIKAVAQEVREKGGKIVVAWGSGGWSRHGHMLRLLTTTGDDLCCFATASATGVTDRGFPYHPSPQGYLRRKPDGLRAEPRDVVLKRFPH